MGGATLGYALAKQGWRVLFVEKGANLHATDASRIAGRFVEDDSAFVRLSHDAREREIARGGRSTDVIRDLARPRGSPALFTPYIGCGTGGSTALYGMALE